MAQDLALSKGVGYSVLIRDNATREERLCPQTEVKWTDDCDVYWWTDGNMGCDCNRSLCFARAGGATEEEAWAQEIDCGDTRFTAIKAILADGREIELDAPCIPE